jgi:sister chromatid cohesion protein DCC1
MNGSVEQIHYDPVNMDQDLLLFELPDSLPTEEETPWIIKGNRDDEAVVCSASRTFALRQVNSSNTVLVIKDAKNIVKSASCHYELSKCHPRVDVILTLLPIYVPGSPAPASLTFDEIVARVCASSGEIAGFLNEIGDIVIVDSKYYRLDPEYQRVLLSLVASEAVLNDLNLMAFRMDQLAPVLAQACPGNNEGDHEIAKITLVSFCKEMGAGNGAGFTLDEGKVCRFFGERILRKYDMVFEYSCLSLAPISTGDVLS